MRALATHAALACALLTGLAACGGRTTEILVVPDDSGGDTSAATPEDQTLLTDLPNARVVGRVTHPAGPLTGLRVKFSMIEFDDPYDRGFEHDGETVPAKCGEIHATVTMDGSFYASVPGGWWVMTVGVAEELPDPHCPEPFGPEAEGEPEPDPAMVMVHQTIVDAPSSQTKSMNDVELTVSAGDDLDGDGVGDELELAGWTIFVNEDGINRRTTRLVTSDPTRADTEGDGLTDAQELALRSDPRRHDTDGDTLSDSDEVNLFGSQPNSVDSDGDAFPAGALTPNPLFFDGEEVDRWKTSPALADTDGDGLNDLEEALGNGRSPLIADIPLLEIEVVGSPAVALNAETTEGLKENFATSELERKSSERSQTKSLSFEAFLELRKKVSTSVSSKIPGTPKVSVSSEFEATSRLTTKAASTVTERSAREAQNTLNNSRSNSTFIKFTDGSLAVALKVTNASGRSVLVQDLSVLAFRVLPANQQARASPLTVVGVLLPRLRQVDQETGIEQVSGFEEVVLPPGGDFTVLVENTTLPASLVEPLLANPSSLFFQVANYTLKEVDEQGNPTADFAALGQRVFERCGMVSLDFGEGQIERFLVATNVERSTELDDEGNPVVVVGRRKLDRILTEILGRQVGFESRTYEEVLDDVDEAGNAVRLVESRGPVRIITTIDDLSENGGTEPSPAEFEKYRRYLIQDLLERDEEGDTTVADEERWPTTIVSAGTGAWIVTGTTDEFSGPARHWDAYTLVNGEVINLIYLKDTDGDRLFDREELLLGTDPTNRDSDYDNLTDFEELNFGWTVRVFEELTEEVEEGEEPEVTLNEVVGLRREVFSDPLVADADEDGVKDKEERDGGGTIGDTGFACQTDPNEADTDLDGMTDGDDERPCTSIGPITVTVAPVEDLVMHFPMNNLVGEAGDVDDGAGGTEEDPLARVFTEDVGLMGGDAQVTGNFNDDNGLDWGLTGTPHPYTPPGVYRFQDLRGENRKALYLHPRRGDTGVSPAYLTAPRPNIGQGANRDFTLTAWIRVSELTATENELGGTIVGLRGGTGMHIRSLYGVPTIQNEIRTVDEDGDHGLSAPNNTSSQILINEWYFCAMRYTHVDGAYRIGGLAIPHGANRATVQWRYSAWIEALAYTNASTVVNVEDEEEELGPQLLSIGARFDPETGADPQEHDAVDRNFAGAIDDVRVYAKALSEDEVRALFVAGPAE